MSISKVGKDCSGCGTCILSCPTHAIRMVPDRDGFEYPNIDAALCIECKKCESVCPVLHVVKNSGRHSCGAAYASDPQIKREGSSGGLFGTIAREIIARGGIVFGAAFDDSLRLRTRSAETSEELQPLYKSKYLLCDTGDCFFRIQDHLKTGRDVLYCSTPCQIAALKLFLKTEYPNLVTVDFVCHGVGNQRLFDLSLEYLKKKWNAEEIKDVVFRYKYRKATSHYYRIGIKRKDGVCADKMGSYMSFPYYYAYSKRLICRESCYSCRYANAERASDITIGDFHTIEKYHPEIDRFAGVSMFVCNTEKGQRLWDRIADRLSIYPMEWTEVYKNNRFGLVEEPRPRMREQFLNSVVPSFEKAVRKYLSQWKDPLFYYYKVPGYIRFLLRKYYHI